LELARRAVVSLCLLSSNPELAMMTSGSGIPANVSRLIDELVRAWAAGDGAAFARPFASRARFIAFDGAVLHGPEAIGRFHDRAFSSHLANTTLQINIDEMRELAPHVAMLFTHGGIRRGSETQGALIGGSVQTFVVANLTGQPQIESFQNTRDRPIKGPREAEVWRAFDKAWSDLGASGA
jgi:uncharacterized protein (TIGR02246 family)